MHGACYTRPTHCIQFINEDNTGFVATCLFCVCVCVCVCVCGGGGGGGGGGRGLKGIGIIIIMVLKVMLRCFI